MKKCKCKTLKEIDLIKELEINEKKMEVFISEKVEGILFDYFREEIIQMSLENSTPKLNLPQLDFQGEGEKEVEFEIEIEHEFVIKMFNKFLEKTVINNYIKIFDMYEEYIVDEEIAIAVLVYGIIDLPEEEIMKQMEKSTKKILKYLDKKLIKYMNKKIF